MQGLRKYNIRLSRRSRVSNLQFNRDSLCSLERFVRICYDVAKLRKMLLLMKGRFQFANRYKYKGNVLQMSVKNQCSNAGSESGVMRNLKAIECH